MANIRKTNIKVKAIVWKNKGADQKLVTIPKSCTIEEGDQVLIEKIEEHT